MSEPAETFPLLPDRQELDLKGFGDPLILLWIYAGASWSAFLGYLWYSGAVSWFVALVFYPILVFTLLLVTLQVLGVVIAFIGKNAAYKRINRADMSVKIDGDTFVFTREDEPVITIPLDALDRIEARVDKNELMLGPKTGYNFVTSTYEQHMEEDEPSANVEVVEEDGDEKYQFWLDSRAIGTSQQIDDFHDWLGDHGLDGLIDTTSREQHYEWTTSDWFWFAVHTLLIFVTIGYAYLNH
jgi:hypothetical protein